MIARLRRHPGRRLSPTGFDLVAIAIWFVLLRLVTFAVMEVAWHWAPPWGHVVYDLVPPHALEPFSRFDATFYIGIAQYGYPAPSHELVYPAAFFPLFPLLVRGATVLLGNVYVAALVVANVAAIAAAFATYGLVRTWGSRRQARLAALWLLASPAGHFLSLPYSESLFCLLLALGLWAVETDRFVAAGVLGALASATRPTGLVIAVALAIRGARTRRPAALASTGLSALGIVSFAFFCLQRYGDPLYFSSLQAAWGRHFSLLGPLVALAAFAFDPEYYLVTIGSLVLAIHIARKREKPELDAAAWALLLVPLFSGTLKSMIRFQGTNVPLLARGASTIRPRVMRWILTLGFALQLWEAGRFAAGFAAN